MRVGIASDHGGFALKEQVAELLRDSGQEVVDFGAHELSPETTTLTSSFLLPGPLPPGK
jgi:ribose 5-phosphate isomerase RpiB